MKILNYRILLREEDEGGYTVLVPSLPGGVTYGDTIDEAVSKASTNSARGSFEKPPPGPPQNFLLNLGTGQDTDRDPRRLTRSEEKKQS